MPQSFRSTFGSATPSSSPLTTHTHSALSSPRSVRSLKRHLRAHHSTITCCPVSGCESCRIRFENKETLEQHLRQEHRGIPAKFTCHCGLTMPNGPQVHFKHQAIKQATTIKSMKSICKFCDAHSIGTQCCSMHLGGGGRQPLRPTNSFLSEEELLSTSRLHERST